MLYELNLGVPAWKGGLVPFGTAGYVWVPESLRGSRGGKHVTAEPVLCLGWQDMYSNVYKVLTLLGTVQHTSKVTWHHDQLLGKFLLVCDCDMHMPAPDMSPVEYDHNIVEWLLDDSEKLEAFEEVHKFESGELSGNKYPQRVHSSRNSLGCIFRGSYCVGDSEQNLRAAHGFERFEHIALGLCFLGLCKM